MGWQDRYLTDFATAEGSNNICKLSKPQLGIKMIKKCSVSNIYLNRDKKSFSRTYKLVNLLLLRLLQL